MQSLILQIALFSKNMFNSKSIPLFLTLFLAAISLFIHGCFSCENEEVTRITSPDRKVDVVHMRGSCGATTSVSEKIFIVSSHDKGKQMKDGYQILIADHVDGLKLVWREPKVLELHYKEARIFDFTNFWNSKDLDDFSYVVEIRLVPLKSDFSLSKRDRWLE